MPNFTDQISQLYNEDKNFQMVSDKAIKEGWAEIEGNLYNNFFSDKPHLCLWTKRS